MLLKGRGAVAQLGGGGPRGDGRVRVQALRHLVTDQVHQPLEGLLHVHVVLGTRLKELKTWRKEQRMEQIVERRSTEGAVGKIQQV